MLIKVLEEDITKGIPGSSSYCPFARAIERDCPSLRGRVRVGAYTTEIYGDPNATVNACVITNPGRMIDWVLSYDGMGKAQVKPITVKLPLEQYCK